jgi:hypothetical protein
MSHSPWLDLADEVEKWATALGIIVGGCWALLRFGLRRESATALIIELEHFDLKYGSESYLVTFDVTFRNMGQVRLTVRRDRNPAYPRARTEDSETLKYGADLLLRRVTESAASGESIQWFTDNLPTSPMKGDIECDLANEYEQGDKTDFWLEPGESYHLSTIRVLAPGYYLAMVTFVGNSSDKEFWRRVFTVQVPNKEGQNRPIRSVQEEQGA